MSVTYIFANLEAVAEHFEDMAREAKRRAGATYGSPLAEAVHTREAATWTQAAHLLRNTTIVPEDDDGDADAQLPKTWGGTPT